MHIFWHGFLLEAGWLLARFFGRSGVRRQEVSKRGEGGNALLRPTVEDS